MIVLEVRPHLHRDHVDEKGEPTRLACCPSRPSEDFHFCFWIPFGWMENQYYEVFGGTPNTARRGRALPFQLNRYGAMGEGSG
jgi:hypothetical protein